MVQQVKFLLYKHVHLSLDPQLLHGKLGMEALIAIPTLGNGIRQIQEIYQSVLVVKMIYCRFRKRCFSKNKIELEGER